MTVTTYYCSKALIRDFQHVMARAGHPKRTLAKRILLAVLGTLFLLCALLLLLIGGGAFEYAFGILDLVCGIMCIVSAIWYYDRLARIALRSMPKNLDKMQFTFSENSILIDNALEHCEHNYSVFYGVCESRRLFVLMLTDRLGYSIDKSVLSEEETENLRNILQTRFSGPLIVYNI